MKKAKSVIFRSLVICSVTGIALLIPDFTTFCDIAGALGAAVVAFILPPLMYNNQFADTITPTRKYAHYALIAFGVCGSTISIVNSILTIMNEE